MWNYARTLTLRTLLINDKRFRALHYIGDGAYEIDLTKNSICMNLPIQIGFFVYQYAKLRMLQ